MRRSLPTVIESGEHAVRRVVVESAGARLGVIVVGVAQTHRASFAQSSGKTSAQRMSRKFHAQRKSVRVVVLAVIGFGEAVGGEQISALTHHKTSAGNQGVNVALVRHDGWVSIIS